MLIACLSISNAQAWNHLAFVHTEPLTLELSTVDAAGAPPGAVQEAIRLAVDRWTDDACLETLEVSVIDTPDNVVDTGDGRNLVGVDHDDSGYVAVTYAMGSEFAFERFGQTYRSYDEVDIGMGPVVWSLDDEAATGVCTGEALSRVATEMVGYALGLGPADPGVDSLFNQPLCSLPVLSEDDRAGLRALYGSGVSADCPGDGVQWYGFGALDVPLGGCTVDPFGPSAALDRWIVGPDSERLPLDGVVSLREPGHYTLEVCGEMDVPAGCDTPVQCSPWPDDFLVCAEPTPAMKAPVDDGEVHLYDLTPIDDETCALFLAQRWTVTDANGDPVGSAEGPEATVLLPEPGVYEVTLTLGEAPVTFETTQSITWASEVEEPADPVDPEASPDAEGADAQGCGCAHGNAGGSGLLVLGLALAAGRRRTVRR